jgi:uncharacterized protein (DUF362 family)
LNFESDTIIGGRSGIDDESGTMFETSVVRYEKPRDSLEKALDSIGGFKSLASTSKVIIKPNFCQWFEGLNFPKYGVITTARMIKDTIVLLREHGIQDITIIEGIVELEKRPEPTIQLVIKSMGLDALVKRYGIKIVDALRGPYIKKTVGDIQLTFNTSVLEADFVINIPVLKTHSQTMVTLGIKNLKGLLSIGCRKRCHTPIGEIDLDNRLAILPDMIPTSLTIIDGIYSLERGPLISGKAQRSDIIIASKDIVSADKVGSTILGIPPGIVPHISLAAKRNGRPLDLSDISIKSEMDIKENIKPHSWEFEQNESGDLPMFFERAGVKGLTYAPVDKTMCTYCSDFISYVISAFMMTSDKDKLFDDIEVLHGKVHEPMGKHKHTLLVGQCQVKKNAKNPLIHHCVEIGGCPPKKELVIEAYDSLGIKLPDDFLRIMEKYPETLMKRYADKPEFDERFYTLNKAE